MSADNGVTSFRAIDYLQPLRRHWLAVLLCVILGIGGAVAYLHWAPKSYKATAAVLVNPPSSSSTTDRATTVNLDTEAQLVTATGTVQAAATKLHLPSSAASDLASHVSVTVPPNSEILAVTYTGSSAKDAQAGASAFAQAYLDQRGAITRATLDASNKALQTRIDALNNQLQQVIQAGAALPANSPDRDRNNQQVAALNTQLSSLSTQQNQVQTTVVDPGSIQTQPVLPTSPASPKTSLVLAAGLILGLLVGAGVVALRNRSDDVIRRPDDVVRRTGVPVTAVLSGRLHDGDVAIQPPTSSDGRGYARLRNLVTTALAPADRPVVLVAGVLHGGGPVAANLAASLARAGEKTCLICADVFGPTASGLLGGAPQAGLAEVLAGEVELTRALRSVPGVPGLQVLGPGRDPDKADALLQTSSARTLVDRLLTSVSYVVIEAPATSDSPDAQTLANTAELAVLVLEIGQVPARDVVDACAQFESVGAPVLGAVAAQYGKNEKAVAVTDEDPEPTTVVPVPTADRRPPPAAPAATGPATQPTATVAKPNGSVAATATGPLPEANGSVVKAPGPVTDTNGSVAKANGALPQTNGSVAKANGALPQANGSVAKANGALPQANGSVAKANGALPQANGSVAKANGALPEANGPVPKAKGPVGEAAGPVAGAVVPRTSPGSD